MLDGTMTLGDLFMYVFFVGLMAAPLVQMASIGTQVSEAFAGLDRIREIREMTTEDQADADKEPMHDIDGNVEFQDVTFEYVPDVPRCSSTCRSPPPPVRRPRSSARAAAGKSTLIGLVMAFNHPKSGRVLVDGKDIANVRLRDYRSHVGVVMQDNFLFDGTVRENIAFSKPGATDEEVRAAAHIAHCDEFVDRFEKGYDTIVGERGVKLSGGQRQRVAIARAVLADPRILILDEATSSLDSESEALIRDGLRSLRRGRTTFVIAHRLSTIESADQILVLENGEIVERGTHRQLIALGGRYRRCTRSSTARRRTSSSIPARIFSPSRGRTSFGSSDPGGAPQQPTATTHRRGAEDAEHCPRGQLCRATSRICCEAARDASVWRRTPT